MLWYLRADRYDLSIADHASIWKSCIKEGKINSNYGFYWLREGFGIGKIVDMLINEPSSRRVVIPILGTDRDHFKDPIHDLPCTETITFYIRDNILYCTVHMRSQDAYFGMGNDVPCFSFLHRIVHKLVNRLKSVELGSLTCTCTNFHVYERHWDKLSSLAKEDIAEIKVPEILDWKEAEYLLAIKYMSVNVMDGRFTFTRWLLDNDTLTSV
jgi:thymidylate synthase